MKGDTMPKFEDLERIVKHIPLGITYMDLDLRIQSMNSYFLDKLGMATEDVVGRHCYAISAESRGENPSAAKPCGHCLVPKAIETGENQIFVNEINPNLIIETTTLPLTDESGQIVGTMELAKDITEQKKLEEALKARGDYSESYLKSIIGAQADCVMLLSPDCEVVEMNPAGLAMLDEDEPEQVEGHKLCHMVDRKDQEGFQEFVASVCEGKPGTFSYQVIGTKGTTRTIESRGVPFKDEMNNRTLMLAVTRDITERKRAEGELKKYQCQLHDMVDERTQELSLLVEQLKKEIDERKEADEALKESEERFRNVFTNSAVGISIMPFSDDVGKGKGRQSVFNKPMQKFFGYSVKELKGKTINELSHPEDMEKDLELFNELLKGERDNYYLEKRYTKKDGKIVWGNLSVALIRDSDDNPIQIVSTLEDITERKEAEDELRFQSEIAANISEGIHLVRASDITIVHTNPMFEEMLGYDPGELIGKHVSTLNAPTDVDPAEVVEHIRKSLDEKGYWHGEVKNIKKDGTEFWSFANVSEFKHPDYGDVFISVHTDITERKEAEDALKESEEKFRAIATTAANAFILMDNNGQIAYWNPAAEGMFGYTEEEAMGRELHQFLAPQKYHKDYKRGFNKFIRSGQGPAIGNTVEFSAVKKDGTKFPIEVSTSAIQVKDQWHAVGIIHDITDRKQAEEERHNYTKEIKRQKELTERITEGIDDGILLLSKDLKVQWANQKAREMSGYSGEEIMGRQCYEITHNKDKKCASPECMCPLNEAQETGKAATRVHVHPDRDGRESYAEVTVYPLKEEGNITGYVHLTRDMTEKVAAEHTIKELKEFNENIVQSMEEGILIEDDEGFVTFANPRMEEMVGCSKEELIGKHWSELFSSDFETKVEKENSRVREGINSRYEAALDHGDRELPVMVSATPLTEGGLHVGNLKVFVDITERKEAEERLREKALKYKVEPAGSYLVTEKVLNRGMDVFKDLLQAGYKGMVTSRTPPEKFKDLAGEDVEVLWFSEKKKGKGTIPPQLNIVVKTIEDFMSRNSVVLLDRLDYLVIQKGFTEVVRFLHELTELTYLAKGILLVVIDPETLSSQELSLLEKEIHKVESKYQVDLDKDLQDILEFIGKENRDGRKPAHKDMVKALGITRPTMNKRVRELKGKGLLEERKKGRYKTLELTERGRETL